MSPETAAVLRGRARRLAQEPEREEVAAEVLPVVEFLLAEEHYALELAHIREVSPLRELTPLPGTPPFVAGMVNVRGQILTVLDLKAFFGLPPGGLTELGFVLIVRAAGMEVGLLADGVLGVRAVPLRDIQPPPPTLTGVGAEYLRGVTPEPLVVLDGAAILSDPAIIVDEEGES